MNRSDTITSIAPAWVSALSQLTDVHKDSDANMGNWTLRYASIGAVLNHVRPVLADYELAVSQEVIHGSNSNGPTIGVATTVTHVSGEWFSTGGTQHPAGPKSGPQDNGSAITYARRYDLLTFLGLATEDDDGGRAQKAHSRPVEQEHPNAERVRVVLDQLTRLPDEAKTAIREWAPGQSFGGRALLDDPVWLEQVESWLDEYGPAVES